MIHEELQKKCRKSLRCLWSKSWPFTCWKQEAQGERCKGFSDSDAIRNLALPEPVVRFIIIFASVLVTEPHTVPVLCFHESCCFQFSILQI